MRDHSKDRSAKPQNRTRAVLDAAEIQRHLSRPRRPTLAERYAQETEAAERDRFYGDGDRRGEPRTGRPPSTVWVTKPILRTRGRTESAVREFLPRSERRYSDPHVKGRSPTPLWSARTAGRIEAADEWQRRLARSLDRRGVTLHDLAESIREAAFRQHIQTADQALAFHRKSRSRTP